MSKFREIFLNLHNLKGNFIGCDPFHHLTIAGVACEGIYCKYFLPFCMIMVVPCPLKLSYLIKQILWLEHMINKTGHWIHHAVNKGEQQITLPDGEKFLVDGLCLQTTTVLQFHWCFFPKI